MATKRLPMRQTREILSIDNKPIFRKYIEEAYNKGNPSVVEETRATGLPFNGRSPARTVESWRHRSGHFPPHGTTLSSKALLSSACPTARSLKSGPVLTGWGSGSKWADLSLRKSFRKLLGNRRSEPVIWGESHDADGTICTHVFGFRGRVPLLRRGNGT